MGQSSAIEEKLYEEVVRHAVRINSIKDLPTLLRSTWDWKIFGKGGAKCFGETNIEPTDIDLVVERNGFYLLMETKLPHKTSIDGGQLILFQYLLWNTPSTLLFISGEAERREIKRLEAWRKGIARIHPARFKLQPCMDAWLGFLRQWFLWADKHHAPEYLGPFWSFDIAINCFRLDLENAIPLEQERYASMDPGVFS